MIWSILAVVVALFAARDEPIPNTAERNPALALDPCVDVDESAVRDLIDLELSGARGRNVTVPISVVVRCIDGATEMRVEPWASLGYQAARTIDLPTTALADPAAQQARSRELALAIAELIRRLEITHPLPSQQQVQPQQDQQQPPPRALPPVVASSPPLSDRPGGRWQLALVSSFDYFTGGQWLAGGDVSGAAPIGRWFLVELRLGGRLADGETLPGARLTARAGTAAAGAGVNHWSRHRSVGLALMFRAQGYGVEYRVESPGGGSRSALLGAFVVVVEPRLLIAITPRVFLTAAVAAGVPLHGVIVRAQGAETESLSGLALSGNLGVVLTF